MSCFLSAHSAAQRSYHTQSAFACGYVLIVSRMRGQFYRQKRNPVSSDGAVHAPIQRERRCSYGAILKDIDDLNEQTRVLGTELQCRPMGPLGRRACGRLQPLAWSFRKSSADPGHWYSCCECHIVHTERPPGTYLFGVLRNTLRVMYRHPSLFRVASPQTL